MTRFRWMDGRRNRSPHKAMRPGRGEEQEDTLSSHLWFRSIEWCHCHCQWREEPRVAAPGN